MTKHTPLIEPEDKQPDEQLQVRLRPDVAQDLRAYGKFSNSSTNHIIAAALKRLFKDDKGFRSFKEENPSAGLTVATEPTPKAQPRKVA